MGKVQFLTLKENIIEKVADIIIAQDISSSLVVFPNKRPGYFLANYLYRKAHKTIKSPLIFSIDEFVDYAFENLFQGNYRTALWPDLIGFIYNDLKKYSQKIIFTEEENYTLANFIGWANKIISDFEEMKINRVSAQKIKKFDFLIGEKAFEKFRKKSILFSEFYNLFYQKCTENGLYTKAMKYNYVAENIEKLNLQQFRNIIFSGFFELTISEKEIFQHIMKNYNDSLFIYLYSPLLKDKLPFKNIQFPDWDYNQFREKVEIYFHKSASIHEEIFSLKNVLLSESKNSNNRLSFGEDTVIISPDASMIMPCIEYVLDGVEKFNISAGYPVKMTPIYFMIKTLFNLLKTLQTNKYEISAYFNFLSHPYIKNLQIAGKAEETRKMFQDLREKILTKGNILNYYSIKQLEEIAGDEKLVQIHTNTIRLFDEIKDIGDFCRKILFLVSYISENSTANRHPYWSCFPQIIIDKVKEIENSFMAEISLKSFNEYADFFESYIDFQSHPFRGSPIEGLQVLGFLESRNLKFGKVFFLDVVNGVIPDVKKEDTILPQLVRENLGISTYAKRRDITLYYFENIIFSADKVHIFYVDDRTREPSPFIEKIKWEMEKEKKQLPENFFSIRADFSHRDVKPIVKDKKIFNLLKEMEYSYSSIDEYLKCQLKFYYSHILKFKEVGEFNEGYEKRDIGIFIHEILKRYFEILNYKKLLRKEEEKKRILKIAEEVFNSDIKDALSLEEYLVKKQISKRLEDFIEFIFENDIKFSSISCEKIYRTVFRTKTADFKLKATLDLVGKKEEKYWIIDYKTSSEPKESLPSLSIENIDFKQDILQWGRRLKSLQLPIYVYVYSQSEKIPVEKINASIWCLGLKKIEEYTLFNEKNPVGKFSAYLDIISNILEDILFSERFLPPLDEKHCKFCPYSVVCDRQWVG